MTAVSGVACYGRGHILVPILVLVLLCAVVAYAHFAGIWEAFSAWPFVPLAV
ncbi:transmembrane protein, putative [Medicago truncatula]|uniref:Transmembrane protein, putative n=1 Tax=Medicago truncatula TaxID=3880 RepID=G7J9G1_MEDTR|nr:transmembrane protein, putative [Medicago truncatula]